MMLTTSTPDFDFSEILARVSEIINFALIDSRLLDFDAATLAVGAIERTMREAEWFEFLDDWMSQLRDHFPDLKFEEIGECSELIRKIQMGSIASSMSISCLLYTSPSPRD